LFNNEYRRQIKKKRQLDERKDELIDENLMDDRKENDTNYYQFNSWSSHIHQRSLPVQSK